MSTIANMAVRLQGQGFSQVRNSIRGVNSELKKTGQSTAGIARLSAGFAVFSMAAMEAVRVVQELAQWVGESISEFRDFEVRMTEVSTILQGTAYNDLPALTAGVQNLSKAFGQDAKDLANGLYDILSAAIDSKDAIELLTIATKASIAGLTTVSISVDVFTSILNSYGKTVAQAADVSDVLFQTVVRGKLRFEDLASAMGYITPIAANAGVAFEEVAAALATVTRQGLHVDMASRGLALLLQGIVDPAQAAAEAAQEFGVEMSGLALRIKGLHGFIVSLSDAAKEYGMSIIPQIVRNMRSLRVAMALAGEEGLAGFTTDLGLMANATNKADEALAKMMDTQQRQAQILATSMDIVERKIGEAWSGIDIWWKKSQLWWGTLISGGDANKALSDFDKTVTDMKKNFVDMIITTNKYATQGKFSDVLREMTEITPSSLADVLDVDRIQEYFSKLGEQTELGNMITEMYEFATALETIGTDSMQIKNTEWSFLDIVGGLGGVLANVMNITNMLPIAAEDLERINSVLEKQGKSALPAETSFTAIAVYLKGIREESGLAEAELTELTDAITNLTPDVSRLREGFDTIGQSIESHKLNILELQNAINELKVEVVDVYTSLNGVNKFNGKLEWEYAVKYDETKLNRFEEFSKMASSYGMDFMDIYIEQYGELDEALYDAIGTIYEYNEAVEAQKEAEEKLRKEMDELLLQMRKNQLEQMKIQLVGMMRRRGLTRMEQNILKKLDIENMKLRIEQMQKEVEAEEDAANASTEINTTKYDEAKKLLDDYINHERFNLWLLKDIRNDELEDLDELIVNKRAKLRLYTGWYNEELAALESESNIYYSTMQALSELMPDVYAELFSTEAMDNFIKTWHEYNELIELGNKSSSSGGSSSTDDSKSFWTGGTSDLWKTGSIEDIWRRVRGYADGTSYVPYTGLYQLHQGEAVTTARDNKRSSSPSGDNISINISVTGNSITENTIQDVAKQIGQSVERSLISAKTGKSKYRLR